MNNNILHALRERSFLFLWIGEIFTLVSLNLFNFFLILIVFNLTQSNTAVSGIVISFTFPAIFFGSIAGAYVDRWDKKKVLIVTNVLRGLLLFILAFFVHNVFIIFVISILVTILTQFFIPAESPIIPLVVKRENLLPANALFGLGIFGSILVAYILSGPLLLLFKPMNMAVFLGFMFLIGAVFISFIQLSPKNKELQKKEKVNLFADIRHTLAIISRTRAIAGSLFLLSLSQILILLLATIAPGYAKQILNINVEDFPLLFVAPAAIGMVVGAIALANFFHNHPKTKVINAGIIISGIAMLFLPYGSKVASRDFVHELNMYLPHILSINILHIMVVLAFFLGLANSLVFVPANTMLQEQTSDEIRGKIYGFMNTIVGALSLLPIILVGGLSDLIGVGSVITGIGVSLLLLGLIRAFARR